MTTAPTERLTLVVRLWVHPGNEDGFAAFEREAARIMARYGGRIDRALRVVPQPGADDAPYEIHLVSFPDRAAWLAYREDTEVQGLAERRRSVVAHTELSFVRDVAPYGPEPATG